MGVFDSDLEFAAFDSLPPELRQALRDALVDWSSIDFLNELSVYLMRGVPPDRAVRRVLLSLRELEAQALAEWWS